MRAVVRPLSLPADRRVLVISDIHGNLPFLKGLLKKVQFSTDDILLVLGDILEKSTGGLDTLPHNGAVLTLLAVSNCTHKESYIDICITTCIIPLVSSLGLALIWGLFL